VSVRMTFIDSHGAARTIEARSGMSVMETARLHQIPEVGSDCGGLCACASCHVYVDPAWLDKFPAMTKNENVLLSLLQDERHPNSRLSCQLKLTGAENGLIVRTPPAAPG
jgi:ferredoxin, 2Fe-2S